MKNIHELSESRLLQDPGVVELGVKDYHLAQSMGLLPSGETIERFDFAALRRVFQALQKTGIAKQPLIEFNNADVEKIKPNDLRNWLTVMRDAMVHCPAPQSELPALEERLGTELLTRLIGISSSSLQRYKSGEREVPGDIAQRLHFLSLVVGDLSGAYNDIGIRMWFHRKRKILGDKTPEEVLSGDWSSEDSEALRVQELAGALTSPMAT